MKTRLVSGFLAIFLAVALAGAGPADAAKKHKKRVHAGPGVPQSALVVDAASGRVLFAQDPDGARYPASLTKMMTAYLTFDALSRKRLSLNQALPVSAHAASMEPSKLGLQPGERIRVEDALLALVTKSANDAAVVLAEAIGGSEEAFAEMMTLRARALGMSHTLYHNASGLPDPEQRTTARDMATLGLALLRDFPGYYRYFATESFAYGEAVHRNHNHMLERYDGVDGIKTGFIRASGFNIVVSAQRDGRRLVAVVFGGGSAGLRDARAAVLLDEAFDRVGPGDGRTVIASAVQAPAPTEIGAPERNPTLLAAYQAEEPESEADPEPAPRAVAKPARASLPVRAAAMAIPAHPGKLGHAWSIQVGAYDRSEAATEGLKTATLLGPRLLREKPSGIVATHQGRKVWYRARVGNLTRTEAQAACRQLARKNMPCLMLPPERNLAQAAARSRT